MQVEAGAKMQEYVAPTPAPPSGATPPPTNPAAPSPTEAPTDPPTIATSAPTAPTPAPTLGARCTKAPMGIGANEAVENTACIFPVTYLGNNYDDCTTDYANGVEWCCTSSDCSQVGYCKAKGADCTAITNTAGVTAKPTPAPTPSPTDAPTPAPTAAPTNKPGTQFVYDDDAGTGGTDSSATSGDDDTWECKTFDFLGDSSMAKMLCEALWEMFQLILSFRQVTPLAGDQQLTGSELYRALGMPDDA